MNIGAIFIKTITLFKFQKRRNAHFKYESLEEILSTTEHSFFLALKESLANDYEIFAKVRISDVLTPDEIFNLRNCNAALYRTLPRHFDYILCEKHTLSIVAVIKLEDKNHIQREVRAHDRFVEKACRAAGFKLLRFSTRSGYCVQAVREIVINSLNSSS
ncbi:MAG: DUF2726 domain-containing protein [Nitrosomonas sp.]|nr:MAG: DUF2726 domain-containing protein [Nitrosomonas sp.]